MYGVKHFGRVNMVMNDEKLNNMLNEIRLWWGTTEEEKQDRQTMTGTTDTGSVYPNGKI